MLLPKQALARKQRYIERLTRDGFLLQVPCGKSMWPMLRDRHDRFLVHPLQTAPKRYDVVVYLRPSTGNMTVHRVVAVPQRDLYVIRGDNCYYTERDVTQADMIGVVCGFYRGQTYIPVTAPAYRFYVQCWVHTYPLRFVLHTVFYPPYHFLYRCFKYVRLHGYKHKTRKQQKK